MFNKDLYRSEVIAHGDTLKDAAAVIGCSEAGHSLKVNGKSDFTREEIERFRDHYGTTDEKLVSIFFMSYLKKT